MRRRDFITFFGGALLASRPQTLNAQQSGKPARIGLFVGSINPVMAPAYAAFLDELRRLGFSAGQNLTVDVAETSSRRPPRLPRRRRRWSARTWT